MRSAHDVIRDHLELAQRAEVEEDLVRNYHSDVVILTGFGVFRGHDGARRLADQLAEELPDSRFEYVTVEVVGDVGFLEWTGEGGGNRVRDGADSFVVRDGKIAAQTIHYTVERST